MSLAPIRAVVWDFDGTLLDTPGVIVEVAGLVLHELGRSDVDVQQIRSGIGLPLSQALARLLDVHHEAEVIHRAVDRYRELWRARVNPRIRELVFPGVHEGLAALHARGVKQGLATGKNQAGADSNVDGAGLRPYLASVAGYDRVPNPKPAGDLTLLVLRELGVAPEEAIVVGDSDLDVQMAQSAGVRSIAVTYGAMAEPALRAARPTWIARSFAEVLQLLEPLLA